MSILIRGMEMPTSCNDCRFAVDGWCYACPPESAAERKRIVTNYCPLVPVPPHGRLIDADAMCDGLAIYNPVVIYAECMPTIIPAEEGE